MRGDQAGVMLLMSEDLDVAQAICNKYGYTVCPIACEAQGVRASHARPIRSRVEKYVGKHVIC